MKPPFVDLTSHSHVDQCQMLQRSIFPQALKQGFGTKALSIRTTTAPRFQTRFYTMASSAPQIHPFTTQVVDAMRSLYPEELADRSWDNVGLLLSNLNIPQSASSSSKPKVLLTNDLTIAVAEEAIRRNATVIVSYHPFLFRPIKSIGLADPHQHIILQLVQANIAVYSPHTAVDAAPGGMADWLADMLPGATTSSSARKVVVTPLAESATVPPNSGYGRGVYLDQPVPLTKVIKAYADGLGGQRYLMIARPKGMSEIRSAAVCPGSGYDVLKDCDAELIVTGEMTHHNALKAVMMGKCVIAAFHSNSERTFLKERMRPGLEKVLRKQVAGAEVLVSEVDEDPFEIVDVEDIRLRE